MSPRRDTSLAPEELSRFLAESRTAILTSNGKDGFPHAAAMWFVVVERYLYMWTYAKSQKARNLERDPRCSVLVESGVAYDELKGVLASGEIELIRDPAEVTRIGVELYERYTLPATGVPVDRGPIAEIERQAAKRVGLRLGLERIASWDHSKLGSA